jgi:hypothetical protein
MCHRAPALQHSTDAYCRCYRQYLSHRRKYRSSLILELLCSPSTLPSCPPSSNTRADAFFLLRHLSSPSIALGGTKLRSSHSEVPSPRSHHSSLLSQTSLSSRFNTVINYRGSASEVAESTFVSTQSSSTSSRLLLARIRIRETITLLETATGTITKLTTSLVYDPMEEEVL